MILTKNSRNFAKNSIICQLWVDVSCKPGLRTFQLSFSHLIFIVVAFIRLIGFFLLHGPLVVKVVHDHVDGGLKLLLVLAAWTSLASVSLVRIAAATWVVGVFCAICCPFLLFYDESADSGSLILITSQSVTQRHFFARAPGCQMHLLSHHQLELYI